jgi:hypothetical protein
MLSWGLEHERTSGSALRAGRFRLLICFFLDGRNGSDGLGSLERIVDVRHILIFGFHMRRSFVIAFVRFVFHGISLLPLTTERDTGAAGSIAFI